MHNYALYFLFPSDQVVGEGIDHEYILVHSRNPMQKDLSFPYSADCNLAHIIKA